MSATTPEPLERSPDSTMLSQVSNEMVRLYKELFGRGPTSARTSWAGDNVVICILDETLTPAEQNLAKLGEHQRLRDTRTFFQYSSVRDFCDPVERLTGRTVRAFISGIDTEAGGMSVETFVLYPRDAEGASRTAASAA
jgi:uncharacterized protein YbcI